MRKLIIDGVEISDDSDCYVIAEIGHNHQGSLEQCKKLFKAAKAAGADCVKLQKRDNRALFTKEIYDAPYNSENAYAATYGAHREFLEFGRDEYVALQKYAKDLEITFTSTAFDFPSADFLAELDMPAYKMASGDLTNIPLLKYVAKMGKPMVLSTGGGTLDEVRRAYEAIMPINPQLCIMQCTSGYPPTFEEINLRKLVKHSEPQWWSVSCANSLRGLRSEATLVSYCVEGISQFSVTAPGYLAKSFMLLVTTVTPRATAWAAINLSRASLLFSRVACRIGP